MAQLQGRNICAFFMGESKGKAAQLRKIRVALITTAKEKKISTVMLGAFILVPSA